MLILAVLSITNTALWLPLNLLYARLVLSWSVVMAPLMAFPAVSACKLPASVGLWPRHCDRCCCLTKPNYFCLPHAVVGWQEPVFIHAEHSRG